MIAAAGWIVLILVLVILAFAVIGFLAVTGRGWFRQRNSTNTKPPEDPL